MIRNITSIPELGRWDDLYVVFDTPAAQSALYCLQEQFRKDINSITPSLLGKWLKSENTSSPESRKTAGVIRKAPGLTTREYRKALAGLRDKIRVVEAKTLSAYDLMLEVLNSRRYEKIVV